MKGGKRGGRGQEKWEREGRRSGRGQERWEREGRRGGEDGAFVSSYFK